MFSKVDVEETDETIRIVGTFIISDQIDKEYLEKKRDDYVSKFLRANLRGKVFNQWAEQPVNELISILERKDFSFPMGKNDKHILLEMLFDFRWQEINEPEIKRLRQFVENGDLTEKEKHLQNFHLLFLERKKAEFVELYKQVFVEPFYYLSDYVDYYIGNLQIADEYIFKKYHETLNEPNVLFGSKYDVMIALGKIGNAAGEESAQIIEKVVYDSEEHIIRARNKVLKRIRTPAENWQICPKCRFGRIAVTNGMRISIRNRCGECDGLGWVEV